jgi:hypothetical protein
MTSLGTHPMSTLTMPNDFWTLSGLCIYRNFWTLQGRREVASDFEFISTDQPHKDQCSKHQRAVDQGLSTTTKVVQV